MEALARSLGVSALWWRFSWRCSTTTESTTTTGVFSLGGALPLPHRGISSDGAFVSYSGIRNKWCTTTTTGESTLLGGAPLPLPREESFPLERVPTTTTCESVVPGIDALLPPLECALSPPAIHLTVPLSHYVGIRLIDASAGLGTTTTTGESTLPGNGDIPLPQRRASHLMMCSSHYMGYGGASTIWAL